ncbi:NMT1/THI5-like protein [Bordetella bronchiseptica 99-R-0433]|uniref:ABC transporter substrate-binding protein n=1 Tax=Bordetella bronchiseptica TaxID=518 RepID=UPI00045A7581|nr:ABC transporter substrate-binding protein [Bordetella bronchiseptica]KCV66768.1 NMT1/THI5-like protein [Bordetella bronchiseptica 99-R-0433]
MQSCLRLAASLLSAALLCLPVPGAAQTATPAKKELLKFNWGAPTADYYALYVAKDQKLFEEVGLEPNFYFFPSGAPLLAGLKSKSLDVITTGLATVFALGQNVPLKLIYWELDHAAAEGLVVDPAAGIASYKDIAKAKAIGAPSGTCAQVSLVLMAKELNLKYSDLNIINIAPPLYGNAFKSKSIQAAVAWSPYSSILNADKLPVVNWASDYTPDQGVCPGLTGVRTEFMRQHPDIGLKLVQVQAKAMDMIRKDPELGIGVLMKYLSVSREVARHIYDREFSRIPSYAQQIDPASPYSLAAKNAGLARKLLIASQALAEVGTIPAPLTPQAIDEAIDPSAIQRYMKGERK